MLARYKDFWASASCFDFFLNFFIKTLFEKQFEILTLKAPHANTMTHIFWFQSSSNSDSRTRNCGLGCLQCALKIFRSTSIYFSDFHFLMGQVASLAALTAKLKQESRQILRRREEGVARPDQVVRTPLPPHVLSIST